MQCLFIKAVFADTIDPELIRFLVSNTPTNLVVLNSYDSNLNAIEILISSENIPLNISENILNLHERKFLISGPNCFATALYSSQIEKHIVGVDGPEFQSALNLFCKPLKASVPGAIGVVSSADYIYHAFTVINDDVVFEKQNPNGGTSGSNTRFEMSVNMKNRMATKECLMSGYSYEQCMPQITYYNCDTNKKLKLPNELKELDLSVSKVKELMAINLFIQKPEDFNFKAYVEGQKNLKDLKKYFASNTQLKASKEWINYYQNKISSLELQEKYLVSYAQSVAQNIQSF